jgi:2-keto-3-deoxy-L-rhamnonate aldolase RhmA
VRDIDVDVVFLGPADLNRDNDNRATAADGDVPDLP